MIRHYLITAFRNLLRHRIYSVINIAGLSIAMASAILIGFYVMHETSYDSFHPNAGRIYRVACNFKFPDKLDELSVASPPVAFTLKRDFPEVESFTQIGPFGGPRTLVRNGLKSFYQEQIGYADSLFLTFFKYPLSHGNAATALRDPNSVVITEETAAKFFGSSDPIGKVLQFDNNDGTFTDYKVTGVFSPLPTNTHLKFETLVSLAGLYKKFPDYRGQWISASLWTFLRLREGTDWHAFENKITSLPDKYLDQGQNLGVNAKVSLHLDPLQSIHLESKRLWDISKPGNKQYVYIFFVIGIFLLLIACINYMNLATARAGVRMREIGMRQVVGGQRRQLVFQLLGESLLIVLCSTVLSLAIAELTLPLMRNITDIPFRSSDLFSLKVLLPLAGVTILVALISGLYPAVYLTSFNPVQVLKSSSGSTGQRGINLRKVLVVFQFTVSAALIVATAVAFTQLNFLRNKDVGFQRSGLMAMQIQDTTVSFRYQSLRNDILELKDVEDVAYAASIPGNPPDRRITRVEGKTPTDLQEIPTEPIYVDEHYFKVMRTQMIAGRTFSREMSTDFKQAFLVNEAAVQKFGWSGGLGKRVVWGFGDDANDGKVVGVVQNVYTGSLRDPSEPIVFLLTPKAFAGGYVLVRMRDNASADATKAVENLMRKYDPVHPVESVFLDQHMLKLYADETRLSELFSCFTLLTIFIACLGLVGLVSFSIEQRRREIGIRKVLGAGVRSVLQLMAREYIIMLGIALVVAFPLSFWLMQRWLENFAFRIGIGIMPFLISAALVTIIALFTVASVAMRAAVANPARTLKYE